MQYFGHEPMKAFLSLGSIFLVVTGGEALYADMGHFGRMPIVWGWYGMVLPSLILNYWGQGAYLMANPENVDKRFFFLMAPEALKLPLVLLATMATVIASQALISGVFSLTAQAVQLDYLPRIAIRHTAEAHSGQIYVPLVNWALMVVCVGLVVGFQSSEHLAAAYGIAVTLTMGITTLIFFKVLVERWKWERWRAFAVCVPLFVIELGFIGANIVKIPKGGWFALTIAVVLMVQMQTWRRGRSLVAARIHRGERPIAEVLDEATDVKRVAGTAVFMFKDLGKAPPALVNNLRHNKVLHKTTLLVSVDTDEAPRVEPQERHRITKVEPACSRCCSPSDSWRNPTCRSRCRRSSTARSTSTSGTGDLLPSAAEGRSSPARPPACTRRWSTCSCCSTAGPTVRAGSSTCRATRCSKWAARSRSDLGVVPRAAVRSARRLGPARQHGTHDHDRHPDEGQRMQVVVAQRHTEHDADDRGEEDADHPPDGPGPQQEHAVHREREAGCRRSRARTAPERRPRRSEANPTSRAASTRSCPRWSPTASSAARRTPPATAAPGWPRNRNTPTRRAT
ncbi:MAG: KUP/HAK/KT family potassium transporter [Ilumatobacteraceae bacterium]